MEKLILQSKIVNDTFTEYLYNQYDIQNREETITVIPFIDKNELNSFKWNIGIILGNSGSGKSTILNKLKFGETMTTYSLDKPLISLFKDKTPDEVCELYFGIGLCSIPTLLRTVNQLSNGERARFELAWKIGNAKDGDTVYFDEYTSVVNRDVAKSMSYALQRYIRKHNLKVVLASCHFDIIEWLQPDWIFNLNKQDKDGNVELERLIYSDDTEYDAYNKLKNEEILSNEKYIS